MNVPNPCSSEGASDVVAVAGIVGTLVGTIIGGYASLKSQERGLQHSDKTRFHERRLTTYAEFNARCNELMAGIHLSGTAPEELAMSVSRSFETIRLIASPPVAEAARQVHAIIDSHLSTPRRGADLQAFNIAMALLVAAIREEVGVALRTVPKKNSGLAAWWGRLRETLMRDRPA